MQPSTPSSSPFGIFQGKNVVVMNGMQPRGRLSELGLGVVELGGSRLVLPVEFLELLATRLQGTNKKRASLQGTNKKRARERAKEIESQSHHSGLRFGMRAAPIRKERKKGIAKERDSKRKQKERDSKRKQKKGIAK